MGVLILSRSLFGDLNGILYKEMNGEPYAFGGRLERPVAIDPKAAAPEGVEHPPLGKIRPWTWGPYAGPNQMARTRDAHIKLLVELRAKARERRTTRNAMDVPPASWVPSLDKGQKDFCARSCSLNQIIYQGRARWRRAWIMMESVAATSGVRGGRNVRTRA